MPCARSVLLTAALCSLLAGKTPAQSPAEDPDMVLPDLAEPIPVTDKALLNDPDHFRFVIVADRTGGRRDGVFAEAVEKTNLLRPEFVISVGDLIEGYTEDLARIEMEWDAFDRLVDRLEMPFFYIPGNHDVTNPVMAEVWKQRYGAAYYHFVYKNTLFLCLNTEDAGRANITDAQVAYFEQVLKDHPADRVRWTLVFMHEPMWADHYRQRHAEGYANWGRVEAMLQDRPFTVFAGHWHGYRRDVRNDRRYYILATAGGASRLRGTPFGEFDHVVWITMTDNGPVMANLMLDGIQPEDVVTVEEYEQAQQLGRSVQVLTEPIRTDGGFKRGASRLIIRNRSELPMRLNGYFGASDQLHVHPHAIAIGLEPGEEIQRDLDLSVMGDAAMAAGDVLAIPFEAEAILEGPKGPIRLPRTTAAAVYRPLPMIRLNAAPTIDGDLSDWSALPIVVDQPGQVGRSAESWTGPEDGSYRFGIAHDDEAVYVAVAVRDDRVLAAPGTRTWRQDSVEVILNVADDPDRSLSRGASWRDRWKTYAAWAASPGDTAGQMVVNDPDMIPPGVEGVCLRTDGGYVAELKIPHSALARTRGDDPGWTAARVNVVVTDMDAPGGERARLWWRPSWRSDQNIPGSGTFARP